MRQSMRRLVFVGSCSLVWLFSAARLVAAEAIVDEQLDFSVVLPEGYVADAEQKQGNVLCAFHLPSADEDHLGDYILVRSLGGILGKGDPSADDVIWASADATVDVAGWKEHEIVVSRVPERIEEVDDVNLNAYLPLKPEAIQLTIFGEVSREGELRSTLQTMVDRVEGKTNWDDTSSGNIRYGKLLWAGIAVLAIIGAAFAGLKKKLLGGPSPAELTTPPTEPGSPGLVLEFPARHAKTRQGLA